MFQPSNNFTIISIHAPTRGATISLMVVIQHHLFQSTLLQEERQIDGSTFAFASIFQSTLLQEERLPVFGILVSNKLISIHAPTRGATIYK